MNAPARFRSQNPWFRRNWRPNFWLFGYHLITSINSFSELRKDFLDRKKVLKSLEANSFISPQNYVIRPVRGTIETHTWSHWNWLIKNVKLKIMFSYPTGDGPANLAGWHSFAEKWTFQIQPEFVSKSELSTPNILRDTSIYFFGEIFFFQMWPPWAWSL